MTLGRFHERFTLEGDGVLYMLRIRKDSAIVSLYTLEAEPADTKRPSPGGSWLSRRWTNSFLDPVLFWPACCACSLSSGTFSASSISILLLVLVVLVLVLLVLTHSPSLSRNIALLLLDASVAPPIGSCKALVLAEAALAVVAT